MNPGGTDGMSSCDIIVFSEKKMTDIGNGLATTCTRRKVSALYSRSYHCHGSLPQGYEFASETTSYINPAIVEQEIIPGARRLSGASPIEVEEEIPFLRVKSIFVWVAVAIFIFAVVAFRAILRKRVLNELDALSEPLDSSPWRGIVEPLGSSSLEDGGPENAESKSQLSSVHDCPV